MTNKLKRVSFETRAKRQRAVITKLISDPLRGIAYDKDNNRKHISPPNALLTAVSQRTASVHNDIESMMQLLPDMELAAQILVSSILSPKDLSVPSINITISEELSSEAISAKMLSIISDFFVNEDSINDKLSDMLHEILFTKGSYIQIIVPESSLDKLINDKSSVSIESLNTYLSQDKITLRPLGLLSSAIDIDDSSSLESMLRPRAINTNYEDLINVSGTRIILNDNPDTIKMPLMINKLSKDRANIILNKHRKNISLEAIKEKALKNKTDREIDAALKIDKRYKNDELLEIPNHKESGRTMTGHPMVAKIASEAVIPAHSPNNPKDHIGYFILLDQYGNPINTSNVRDHYRDLQTSFNTKVGSGANQLSTIMGEMTGNRASYMSGSEIQTIKEATDAFSDILERKLLQRVRDGLGHASVELAKPTHIYQTMLARLCMKKHTQLLYIPAELVSYMAFDFTNQGVGRSLLEKTRILGSIRVLLMFANTMAQVRNSTSRTEVNVQLDPEDTDPFGTLSLVQDGILRSRSEGYPLGEGDPTNIINFIQRAGIDIVYNNHPGLPDMKVETNTTSGSKALIDSDLEEKLRHQHIMAMGLSPETVDISRGVNFATSIVNSSLLLSKRVVVYQSKFEPMLAEYIKKYTRNSEILLTRLTKAVMDHGNKSDKNNVETIIENFIDSIEVNLPDPDTVTITAQAESFQAYEDLLDKAINSWISDEFVVADAEGDVSGHLREIRVAVKSYFMRKWLRENNILPELEDLTQVDEDGKPLFKFDEYQSKHMDTILGFVANYLKKARKAAEKRDAKLNMGNEDQENQDNANSGQDEPEEDTGQEEGTEEGDDFNLDEEMGEEEAPEEEAPEDEENPEDK